MLTMNQKQLYVCIRNKNNNMKTKVTVHEEQKTNVINWDVPQLVIGKRGTIIQTNGKHIGDDFEGMVMSSSIYNPYSFDTPWDKASFTPFYGSITLTNINE